MNIGWTGRWCAQDRLGKGYKLFAPSSRPRAQILLRRIPLTVLSTLRVLHLGGYGCVWREWSDLRLYLRRCASPPSQNIPGRLQYSRILISLEVILREFLNQKQPIWPRHAHFVGTDFFLTFFGLAHLRVYFRRIQNWELLTDPKVLATKLADIPSIELEAATETARQHRSAVLLCNVGRSIWVSSRAEQENSPLSAPDVARKEKEIYLEALTFDKNCGIIYNALGAFLMSSSDEFIEIDGEQLSRAELFKKALVLVPDSFAANFNLASLLNMGESVELSDGRVVFQKDLWIKVVDLQPEDPWGYNYLASAIGFAETVTLLNGTVMTPMELFAKAASLDPKQFLFWSNLALNTPVGGSTIMSDGTTMTRQELCLKGIELRPDDGNAYFALGECLDEHGNITLPNGDLMNRLALHKKAIHLTPELVGSYAFLASTIPPNGTIQLMDGRELTAKELLLVGIDKNPVTGAPLLGQLASLLGDSETVQLLDGQVLDKFNLISSGVTKNVGWVEGWRNLLAIFPAGKTEVDLVDGSKMPKDDIMKVLILFEPDRAENYITLADSMTSWDTPTLINEDWRTRRELYLKAIELAPTDARPRDALQTSLAEGETIQLPDGSSLTKTDSGLQKLNTPTSTGDYRNALYLYQSAMDLPDTTATTEFEGKTWTQADLLKQAISVDPEQGVFYLALGNFLKPGETIDLMNGETLSAADLYARAIDTSPQLAYAYNNLAVCTTGGGSVVLLDGSTLTKKELYLKAIEADPEIPEAYFNLAVVSGGSPVTLLSGKSLTEEELYRTAYSKSSSFSSCLVQLASLASYGGQVKISDEETLPRQDCYLRAIELEADEPGGYRGLANLLGFGEAATLPDGQELSREELNQKAVQLEQSPSPWTAHRRFIEKFY